MKKEYTFDRTEGEIAVCISRDDESIMRLSARLLEDSDVPEGGIFELDSKKDAETNISYFRIKYLAEKTAEVKSDANRRLSELFGRGKRGQG